MSPGVSLSIKADQQWEPLPESVIFHPLSRKSHTNRGMESMTIADRQWRDSSVQQAFETEAFALAHQQRHPPENDPGMVLPRRLLCAWGPALTFLAMALFEGSAPGRVKEAFAYCFAGSGNYRRTVTVTALEQDRPCEPHPAHLHASAYSCPHG
jgi:hypothetical protein